MKKTKPALILTLSLIAYALTYTLRLNIAIVITYVTESGVYTLVQMGFAVSAFFVTYTIGQVVSGYLGEQFNSKILVITGLALSALANLLAGLSSSFTVFVIAWTLNGFFQSMLWGPLVKTLSLWFSPLRFGRVSFIMSISLILGHSLSWGFSSVISNYLGWRYAFIVPVFPVIVFLIVFSIFYQTHPPEEEVDGQLDLLGKQKISHEPPAQENIPLLQHFKLINLPALAFVALAQGLIREGIGTWLPTIISDLKLFPSGTAWKVLILIPATNFLGVLFVRLINKKNKENNFATLKINYALALVFSIILIFIPNLLLLELLVMIIFLAIVYGMTPLFTSAIPFQFARQGWVSLTAGVLDAFIYLGAALSGMLSGMVIKGDDREGVKYIWLGGAVIAFLASLFLKISKEKKSST